MYEVIIKHTRQRKKFVGSNWEKIGEKEVLRDSGFYRGDDDEPKTRIAPVFGYTPEIEKTVEEEVEVLHQCVDTIDLTKVIKAINNID